MTITITTTIPGCFSEGAPPLLCLGWPRRRHRPAAPHTAPWAFRPVRAFRAFRAFRAQTVDGYVTATRRLRDGYATAT